MRAASSAAARNCDGRSISSFGNRRPNRSGTSAGAINGGFYTKTNDMPAQYPCVVIAVDDIREAMGKVTKAGGKVLGDPMEIPGVGQYVSFFDTEGNRVSMLQPSREMASRPKSLHA